MFGRYLGFGSEGFLSKLVPIVVENFGDVFPELRQQESKATQVLESEEALFNRTLDRGLRLFEEALPKQQKGEFSAETAFKLYDTYGFPVDLTEILVRERGLTLDLAAVQRLLETQRERSRAARETEVISAVEETVPTEFVGFYHDEAKGKLVSIVREQDQVLVSVDRSPFYAEMGGQVGDTGEIVLPDGQSIPVSGLLRQGRTFYLKLDRAVEAEPPVEVVLKVNQARRRMIEANHTATHLLHWALHEIVGSDVRQKGSYVGPDYLRFDFNSQPLTHDQVRQVQELVNRRVISDDPVSWIEVPFDEVRSRPEIMQFFGEKYGNEVRVVQIGGNPGRLDGYSMELCGGTHVWRTGQIGTFRITSEGAIAAGVRRIEALTGMTAFQQLQSQLDEKSAQIELLNKELVDLRKSIEKQKAQTTQREAERFVSKIPVSARAIVETLDGANGDYLQAIANVLKARRFDGAAIFFGKTADQIHVLAHIDTSLTKQVQAGRVVQELTQILGGKGGGRPDLARGVGKDLEKLGDAVQRAKELLANVR
jgi:alanyl-tRNA synthetase